jgi:hypothetical protein
LAMLCNPQNSTGGDQQLAVQCQPPEETKVPLFTKPSAPPSEPPQYSRPPHGCFSLQ